MNTENASSVEVSDLSKTYKELVSCRKACRRCNGLHNPSEANLKKYDSEHIGPWSCWQGNLNSRIVVVGQDWGDISYYTKWKGIDPPQNNRTNENLQKFLSILGIQIGKPLEKQEQVVFFTNLILCLKTGGLQASIEEQWLDNCSRYFFKPLMNIIKPQIIISLGKKVSESILDIYNVSFSRNDKYSTMLQKSPFKLTNSTYLFPVYHCGAKSINLNRSFDEQQKDWIRIANWLVRQNIIL